jgi:hypothetical protein
VERAGIKRRASYEIKVKRLKSQYAIALRKLAY